MADAIKGSTVLAEEMVLLMDLEVEKKIYIYIFICMYDISVFLF